MAWGGNAAPGPSLSKAMSCCGRLAIETKYRELSNCHGGNRPTGRLAAQ